VKIMKKDIKAALACRISLIISFCAVLIFIYANSLRPSGASSAESQGIFAMLVRFFSFLPFFTHTFVRKLAHFAEYTLLGLHLAAFPLTVGKGKKREYFFTLCAGVLVALTDELLQVFVPGRYGSVMDVALDMSGVFFGYLLYFLSAYAVRRLAEIKKERAGCKK